MFKIESITALVVGFLCFFIGCFCMLFQCDLATCADWFIVAGLGFLTSLVVRERGKHEKGRRRGKHEIPWFEDETCDWE